jgi:hypothetical protein
MVVMPPFPTFGKLRQENHEFKASMGLHSETLPQKINKKVVSDNKQKN